MLVGDGTDDCSVPPQRTCTHRGEHWTCSIAGDDRQKLALVGYVKWIEPKNLARSFALFAYRNPGFIQEDADAGGLGNFGKRARDSASGRIPEHVNIGYTKNCADEVVKWSRVACDFSFKLKSLSHGHDRDSMDGDLAANDHLIS